MKELYLHIGQPKTGTSALQRFFSMNREKLKKMGVCYPLLDEGAFVSRFMGGNAAGLRRFAIPFEQFGELHAQHIQQIRDLFDENDRVLLSEEELWDLDSMVYANILSSLGSDIKVRVIVYLRRQDEHMESMWNQIVKSCKTCDTCAKYAKKHFDEYDYYGKLRGISDVVGKENVIVRIYDTGKYSAEYNIFTDFMSIFGMDDISALELPEHQFNPSLDKNMVEIRRILNELPTFAILQEDIRNILREYGTLKRTDDSIKKAPSFLSFVQRKEILERFYEGNISIAREYLNMDKNPFPELCEEELDSENDGDMYSDIIYFFGRLMVELAGQIEKLQSEREAICIPKEINKESRVIVYGADRNGRRLYHQLKRQGSCEVVGLFDLVWYKLKSVEPDVQNPDDVMQKEFDYALIGVSNDVAAEAIRRTLITIYGVDESKILRIS